MNRTTNPDRASVREERSGLLSYTNMQLQRVDRYIKARMLWHRLYRATSYVKSALWVIPFIAIVIVLIVALPLRWLDDRLDWRFSGLHVAGATALYQTVITLTLSFVVFTFGSLLVAIQVAGGQLTPRIIATALLRDNVVRYSVGLFVFTLVYSVMALDRLDDKVHDLVAFIGGALGVSSIACFLFLIDYAARLLRPVSILARIGDDGLKMIRAVYPVPASESPEVVSDAATPLLPAHRIVRHLGSSGIVLAVDLETLVEEARKAGGIIEFVPHVGDFVAFEEPLFALYGSAASIDDRKLLATVALGAERTLEQDPIFAFRILVDIGLKALSPAINDPTTGVLAIDQVHRLLREIGKRQMHTEEINDDMGEFRVIYRTPNWEDYVHISCNEIRNYGAGNVQVARRLRAMLENLCLSLPAYRHPPLLDECRRLDDLIDRVYTLSDDRALARIPDSQGLGGASHHFRRRQA